MGDTQGYMGWGQSLRALVAASVGLAVAGLAVSGAVAPPPPAEGVDDGLHEPPPIVERPTCIEAGRRARPVGLAGPLVAQPGQAPQPGGRDCQSPICWMGGTPEGEADCYNGYVDTFNAGCNSDPASWGTTIHCGETICGSSGNYLMMGSDPARDTDWLVFTATQDVEYTFTVRAEFPVVIGLMETSPAGSGDCDDMTGWLKPAALGGPCQQISVTQCVAPGTYWLFVSTQGFEGVPCGSPYEATLTCVPCDGLSGPECPPDTLAGQRAYAGDEGWRACVSNSRFYDWTEGIKRFEYFQGVSAANGIEDVHWWGLSAVYDDWGFLVECPLEPGTFEIEFWAEDEYTNRPDLTDPNNLICSYTLTAPELTKSDSGHVYGDYTLWMWHAQLPSPCYMEKGWLSIQNTDYCMFWWAGSPEGGTIHLVLDERNGNLEYEEAEGDLSYCLTGTYTPIYGACCDTYNYHPPGCTDTVQEDCVGFGQFFHANVTCAQINNCIGIYEEAACCDSQLNCFDDTTYWFCLHEGGTWHPGESCWLGFQCPPPPPPPPIHCDPDAKFAQSLNNWSWLFPSWVENNDYRWVDNYQLTSGTSVNRLHYWGIGTLNFPNDGCDFGGGPIPVRVKFYETDPNSDLPPPAPKWYAPLCAYDTVATFGNTGYYFPPDRYIYRFAVLLPSPCVLPDGWFSVQQIRGNEPCQMSTLTGQNGNNRAFICDSGGCEEWVWADPPTDMAFCLYKTPLSGACCDLRDGSCQDDVSQDQCTEVYQQFYPGLSCWEVLCNAVPGACCDMETGDCEITLWADCQGAHQEWLGPNSTCDQCCVAACPPDGILEGEPVCGPGYVDTTNGGCNSPWPVFLPLEEGEVVCGEGGNYELEPGVWRRDTDWYQVVVPEPAALTWQVQAEFRTQAVVLGDCAAAGMPRGDANCDGIIDAFDIQPFVQALTDPGAWEATYPDCNLHCVADINCDGVVDGFDIQGFVQCLVGQCPPCDACGPIYQFGRAATSDYCAKEPALAIVGPGTYWLFVSNYYEGPEFEPACGTPYVGWYTLGGAGGCVLEPGVCELRTEPVCLALGGVYLGDGQPCPE